MEPRNDGTFFSLKTFGVLVRTNMEVSKPNPLSFKVFVHLLFVFDIWLFYLIPDDMFAINNDPKDILKEKDPMGHTIGVNITVSIY